MIGDTNNGASQPTGRSLAPATIDDLVATVRWTVDYDRSVDERENGLLEMATQCMNNLDIEGAIQALRLQQALRSQYILLLRSSEGQLTDQWSEHLPVLEAYASDMSALGQHFLALVEAMKMFIHGHQSEALHQIEAATHFDLELSEANQVYLLLFRSQGELLTGLMRRSALDHAGARAAYDRAALYSKTLFETLLELDDSGTTEAMRAAVLAQVASSEGKSFEMQYMQLVEARDFLNAAEAARCAAMASFRSAELLGPHMPVIASFTLASAHEQQALAETAQAHLHLENGEWDLALQQVRRVREKFEEASRAALNSGHPSGALAQERYLNTAFSWMTAFRREVDRDRANQKRISQLKDDLDNFYGAVRNALAPADVVVNNRNDAVNIVQQQSAITMRLESNIRDLLRSSSDSLLDADLPAPERDSLRDEALQLADDRSDPASFFGRVKDYAQKLSSTLGTAASIAGPVFDLLKATSLIR